MKKRTITLVVAILGLVACQRQSSPVPTNLEGSSVVVTPPEGDSNELPTSTQHQPTYPIPDPIETATPIPLTSPETSIYGVHIHELTSSQQLSLGQQVGANWIRFDDFNWDTIEPERMNPPAYHWDTVDEEGLRMAAESGFEIIGIVLFTPGWAQKYPGVACGPIAEEALDEFAQFMGALVSRYSQPPYNMRYWEIGNEPDVDWSLVQARSGFGCWGEANDPYYGGSYYAEMLKAVYPSINAADPNAQVLIGGLLLDCDPSDPPEHPPDSGQYKDCTTSRFLEGILSAGGGEYFDGVSFHAYDYYYGEENFANGNWNSESASTGPVLIVKSRYLRELLKNFGYNDKYLINSELALLCGSNGKEPSCQADDFSNTKANYIAQAYAAALAEGFAGNVWYSLTGWRASGLVNASLEPFSAYNAYSFSETQFGEAVFIREVDDFPGLKGYEFTRDGNRIWIIWSLDGGVKEIQLQSIPSAVYNVYGESIPSEMMMNVDASPVYFEWVL